MNDHNNSNFQFLEFRLVCGLGRTPQIFVIASLFTLMTFGYYFEVQTTGRMAGYSPGVSLLFVPIYEEIIFRGVFLKYFEKFYNWKIAILMVSLLFGLWHLKNIFWLDAYVLSKQIAYTALIFSPIMCLITIKTRTVWPAVALHFLNNFPYKAWLSHLT